MFFARAVELNVFFLVLMSSSAFLTLWKDGGARPEGLANYAEYAGPLVYVPYVWATLALVFSLFLALSKKGRLGALRSVYGLAPFLAYLFVSIVLAEDKFEAVKVYVLLFSGCFSLLVGLGAYGLQRTLRGFEWGCVSIVLMSFFYSLLVPSYGIAQGVHDGLWQGVFAHKNNLGNFSLLSLLFFLLRWRISGGTYRLVFAGLSLLLVVLSGSTASLMTSLLSLGLATIFYVVPKRLLLKKFNLIFKSGLFMILGLSVFLVVLSLYLPDVQFMEKDSSYSGRDKIWLFFLLRFYESPLFGYGLGQVTLNNDSIADSIYEGIGFAVSSTHNGYIDLLCATGIVGFFLFGRFVLNFSKNLSSKSSILVVWLGVLPILFLNSFESRLVSFNVYFYFLILCSLWARSIDFSPKNR